MNMNDDLMATLLLTQQKLSNIQQGKNIKEIRETIEKPSIHDLLSIREFIKDYSKDKVKPPNCISRIFDLRSYEIALATDGYPYGIEDALDRIILYKIYDIMKNEYK